MNTWPALAAFYAAITANNMRKEKSTMSEETTTALARFTEAQKGVNNLGARLPDAEIVQAYAGAAVYPGSLRRRLAVPRRQCSG
jgi:hypothetical protein